MARLIGGGIVLELKPEKDGIDIRVGNGCDRPGCRCGGQIQVWTKIAPTNLRIKPGDRVWWRMDQFFWKHNANVIRRLGPYRRIRNPKGNGGKGKKTRGK